MHTICGMGRFFFREIGAHGVSSRDVLSGKDEGILKKISMTYTQGLDFLWAKDAIKKKQQAG